MEVPQIFTPKDSSKKLKELLTKKPEDLFNDSREVLNLDIKAVRYGYEYFIEYSTVGDHKDIRRTKLGITPRGITDLGALLEFTDIVRLYHRKDYRFMNVCPAGSEVFFWSKISTKEFYEAVENFYPNMMDDFKILDVVYDY